MKIAKLLMLIMCMNIIGCDGSKDSDSGPSLFHAVKDESKYFNALLSKTQADAQNYDGEKKFFDLLGYWQSVMSLRDYMVQAKSTLTNSDVASLISSVEQVAPARNIKIVLNKIPYEYIEQARLITADLYRVIDMIVADYTELTQDTIDLGNFQIVLAAKEQTIKFFNNENCGVGNERGDIKGIATVYSCDDLVSQVNPFEQIESISVNGACTSLENNYGGTRTLKLASACFTKIIHNNIDQIDTSNSAAALAILAEAKLANFYNSESCYDENSEVKMIIPAEYESCGYIEYQRFNRNLYDRIFSRKIGNTCSDYKNNYGGSDDEVSFQYACEILYTEEI